jgi:hypothetical protein
LQHRKEGLPGSAPGENADAAVTWFLRLTEAASGLANTPSPSNVVSYRSVFSLSIALIPAFLITKLDRLIVLLARGLEAVSMAFPPWLLSAGVKRYKYYLDILYVSERIRHLVAHLLDSGPLNILPLLQRLLPFLVQLTSSFSPPSLQRLALPLVHISTDRIDVSLMIIGNPPLTGQHICSPV